MGCQTSYVPAPPKPSPSNVEVEVIEPSEHGADDLLTSSILQKNPQKLFRHTDVGACFKIRSQLSTV